MITCADFDMRDCCLSCYEDEAERGDGLIELDEPFAPGRQGVETFARVCCRHIDAAEGLFRRRKEELKRLVTERTIPITQKEVV